MTEPWKDRDVQGHSPPLAGREAECHTASGGGEQPGEMAELAHVRPSGAAPESAGPTHWPCGFLMRPHHVLMTDSQAPGIYKVVTGG